MTPQIIPSKSRFSGFASPLEIINPQLTYRRRIETAVHRYLARRKWTSIRRSYFTKWMRFGGVDPEPKTFTSNVSPEDLEGLTNKEKKQALAPKPYVAGEEVDEKGNLLWEVDFELVCKAFLYVIRAWAHD